jgi:hypothetical protein
VVWPRPSETKQLGLHGHWPNMKAKLPYMVQIVVVLLRQCKDQRKIGIPRMEVHITSLVTD